MIMNLDGRAIDRKRGNMKILFGQEPFTKHHHGKNKRAHHVLISAMANTLADFIDNLLLQGRDDENNPLPPGSPPTRKSFLFSCLIKTDIHPQQ